ncbi:uncharacterized protein L969DRAFT_20282 [Mixia osmundae IAM 14324]|uniref:tRNA(His) guanylyltransferase n=1 Tax=Mixia osmundae (strain CBS 9802 / IAM 14324 / JCM 22182 / KY 12970) TaxID=764103 RepID=G7E889_MIXOS|nr:uncharacterized protein L969DRAFT_20282 [Mixia osmundae IAM 14324]KEI36542.1 hypothetical protein L969DRAFT_20282 [Mixia osmundae IAM 14324]GAA99049.1 hypothetical protein E5Q_05738 [Mixia osmundae IAM 14324]
MANSQYGYVRLAERDDTLLPSTYLVVRIDGKGFHKFSKRHNFTKPNDLAALRLMNHSARNLMMSDAGQTIVAAFGQSDEYSFVLSRSTTLFLRRESKIVTTFVSMFTSYYVRLWSSYFPQSPLEEQDDAPSFDGRVVQYPLRSEVIDYLNWRQVDTHINNLYNTTFWALVQQGGKSPKEAHAALQGTVSADKNETLFTQFGINYSKVDPIFRKGTLLLRTSMTTESASVTSGPIVTVHEDIIKPSYWNQSDRSKVFPT